MSRKTRQSVIAESFMAHTRDMRNSLAWRALSFNDIKVLFRLEEEHMAHAGTQNGKLICTYDDFEKAGVRRQSIARSIRRLEELGFVRVVKRGARSISDIRIPSRYCLTYIFSRDRSDLKTDDWSQITSDEDVARALARADKRRNHKTQPTDETGIRQLASASFQ